MSRFVDWFRRLVNLPHRPKIRQMVENASGLYIAKFTQLAIPMIMVPYLSRVLGPDTWGLVVFVQAVGIYVLMIVEYSFELSGTREVARHQDNPSKLAELVSGVLGARLMLVSMCFLVLGALQLLLPAFRDVGLLLWLGALWYAGQAFQPVWFFVGIERVGPFVTLSVSTRIAALLGVFLLVNAPEQAWMVFALQATATVSSSLIGAMMVYRRVLFLFPNFSGSFETLRVGWNTFALYVSSSAYSMSNTIILGFVAAPSVVAFYAGAERIIRLLVTVSTPALMVMFPHATGLATRDQTSAARLARMSSLVVCIASFLTGVVLFVLAPFVIRVVLGAGYEPAATVLRILVLILPIVGITSALTLHWIMPNGMERQLTRVVMIGAAVHVPLAFFLGIAFGHVGVAWALVVTESLVLTLLLGYLYVTDTGPTRANVIHEAHSESTAST